MTLLLSSMMRCLDSQPPSNSSLIYLEFLVVSNAEIELTPRHISHMRYGWDIQQLYGLLRNVNTLHRPVQILLSNLIIKILQYADKSSVYYPPICPNRTSVRSSLVCQTQWIFHHFKWLLHWRILALQWLIADRNPWLLLTIHEMKKMAQ